MSNTTDVSWRRLRAMVKKRDKSTCYHCSEIDENGHCDHLIPLSKGGTDSILNLVWSCEKCNLKKRDKLLKEDVFDPAWLNAKDTPKQSQWDYLNQEFDKFIIDLLKLTIYSIIPPYPEYTWPKYGNFSDYFFAVLIDRLFTPITGIIRRFLYPMPAGILAIYAADNRLMEIRKHLIKGGKVRKDKLSIGHCPVCNSRLGYYWLDNPDKSIVLNWVCSNDHKGESKFENGKQWMAQMYTIAMNDVYYSYYKAEDHLFLHLTANQDSLDYQI